MAYQFYWRLLVLCHLLSRAVAVTNSTLWTFLTESFQPPYLNITTTGEDLTSGYIFLGIRGSDRTRSSTVIYDQTGNLVYHGDRTVTSNVNIQTLFGQPVLTFWDGGMLSAGYGYGDVHILDDTYREIHTVTLPDHNFVTANQSIQPSYIDFHESKILDRTNTILVTAFNVTRANLSPVGGPEDGWVVDSLFFEIDIPTNEVVFSWSTLDHLDQIPLTLSMNPIGTAGQTQALPWDPYHINSVQAVQQGYLISLRHMWSGFYLYRNGTVRWQLNGNTGGDFDLDAESHFAWQHHIQAYNEQVDSLTLSLLDNNYKEKNLTGTGPPSKGLILHLDLANRSVTNMRTLADPNSMIYSFSEGSVQLLGEPATGHALIDYGAVNVIREFDADGQVIMSTMFGGWEDFDSYRAFKQDWHATPFWDPVVVVLPHNSSASVDLFMSWNGATDYNNWAIYGGASNSLANLTFLQVVPRQGFETNVTLLTTGMSHVQVVARKGEKDLRASTIVSTELEVDALGFLCM